MRWRAAAAPGGGRRLHRPDPRSKAPPPRRAEARPPRHRTIARQITADRVAEAFAHRKPSRVVRYDLPKLAAFNFVLDDVLEGGVNSSLGLDGHGKSLSFVLLDISLQVEDLKIENQETGS